MPELRAYQRKVLDQLYAWFKLNHEGNPCIVLPTGSGKSHVIAELCHEAVQTWKGTRILMLTHVKELIEQDAAKLLDHWPDAPLGIYSAGLDSKELDSITFAGIQSIWKRADLVGHIDLVLIDEAHLVSHKDEGMYRTFIDALRETNKDMRVVGFTATPYRLGHGMITDKPALFDALIEPVSISKLQRQGYLAILRSKVTAKRLEVDGVHTRGGEYIESELQAAVDVHETSEAVVDEVLRLAGDRRAWLVFCTGVKHARNVASILKDKGIPSACVTGETPKSERDAVVEDFRNGVLRAVTNANVLTTGFDHPDIDLIVMMRPTLSPGLYMQMAGRGLRIKSQGGDCLVLDFAGVVQTHGPITQVKPPKRKGKGPKGVAPCKICSECDEIIAGSAKICPSCGYEFSIAKKSEWYLHDDDISGKESMVMRVSSWKWATHIGAQSGREMIMVSYYGDLSDPVIREYLTVFHEGYAGQWAMETLGAIAQEADVNIWVPDSPEKLIDALNRGVAPSEIRYRKTGKFYRVVERTWRGEHEQNISRDGR